jgi:hypothetical protein
LDRLRSAKLRTIYRTHFGPATGVDEELSRFERVLEQGAEWIREMLERGLGRERMIEEFSELTRGQATKEGVDETVMRAYELANPRSMSVDGIARYWHKRSKA